MVTLYILRHGEPQVYGKRDSPLSPQGRLQISRVAEHMSRLAPYPVQIYTSPVLRAVQSAEQLGLALGLVSSIRVEPRLLPDADVELLIAHLHDSETQNALLVGHIPQLERLLNRFVDGCDSGLFRLAPGSLVGITFDVCAAGCARVAMQFHPLTSYS